MPVMLDRCPRLAEVPGLVHGFSDRLGGVSTGRYATLNLGGRWGDAADAVDENHARLAAAGGYDVDALRMVRQVHGAAILRASAADRRGATEPRQADALWCHRDDAVVVGVMTADCVPILLADRTGTVAAAVHSGWRGAVADIAGAAVAALPVPPAELLAAIGPCIEVGAFEVGEEVAREFDPAFVDRSLGERPHVDLVAVVTAQLHAAGVREVSRIGACTHDHPERWFSYRRDGAGIGQMLAFVGYAAR